jgi:YfiH family protein
VPQPGFQIITRGGLKLLQANRLAREAWMLHGFSTRVQGVSKAPAAGLNLGYVDADKRKNVDHNREKFFRALRAEEYPLAELRQIHSTLVYEVARGRRGKLEYNPSGYPAPQRARRVPPAGDALITREPGVLLSIRAADCMPVLLADPRRRAVAAIHAGWRGALAGAVEKTVGEMVRIFDTRPGDLLAAVGPSIGACCYQVGDEVVNAFSGRYRDSEHFFVPAPHDKVEEGISRRYPLLFLSKQPPGHGPDSEPTLHLDLAAVARLQLRRAGVMNSKIQVSEFCTACRTDLFFSHRQEGGKTGRMMAAIGIKD